MAKSVVIRNIVYPDVPVVDIPLENSGTAQFVDASDGTAQAGQILNGYTAYVGTDKVTGNIPSKAAATITPTTADQTINSGQYLAGNQKIEGVVVSGLSPANIASGVTVKVGTATDDDSVASVTGILAAAVISQDATTKVLYIS